MIFNQNEKVKLFTHTDLDGVGCSIVANVAFRNVDVTYCENSNVDELVGQFYKDKEYDYYDSVFITDLSVNPDVALLIQESYMEKGNTHNVFLLDHHGTATWLNERYDWALVAPEIYGKLQSGTNLLFDFLTGSEMFEDHHATVLGLLVEKIRRYDTWEWSKVFADNEARDLNQLLYLVGREEFVSEYLDRILHSPRFTFSEGSWLELFSDGDKLLIKNDNQNKRSYTRRKRKQMRVIEYNGFNIGVVFAERYISELGNDLSSENPELKFIAIIDMGSNKVSLRTIHKDIDLGKDIARKFGGGGHPQASGFSFNPDTTLGTIEGIFNPKQKSLLKKIIDKYTKK